MRVLHNVSTEEAAAIVDRLVERETPWIWDVNGKLRVLNTSFVMRDKTLLLLHRMNGPANERDLVAWLEHSNASVYRRDILRKLHAERLIEYDADAGTVILSPKGVADVEERLLNTSLPD